MWCKTQRAAAQVAVYVKQHGDMAEDEFTDPGLLLQDLGDVVFVVCPRCTERAEVVEWPREASSSSVFRQRRLVCQRCGHTKDWTKGTVRIGDGVDPWFHEHLWLREDVRGHLFWAWNVRHLDLIEAFLSARVRRRPIEPVVSASLIMKLPAWMKAGGNRDALLAAIRRLRESLESGPRR